MTPFKLRAFTRIGVLAVALAAFAAPAWAQEEGEELPPGPGEGGIISVSFLPSFTFDGKIFDGQTIYEEENGSELGALPKLDKHASFRGVLGFRKGPGALEIGYERTKFHGSMFGELPVPPSERTFWPLSINEATFQAINIDGRVFVFPRSRVQPHFLVGVNFPFLSVKDGNALDASGSVVGDAKWSGNGLNTEAGVTVYPVRRMGIGVGYSYRIFWFDRADSGVSDKQFELRPRFRETAGSLVFNVSFIM